MIELISDEPFLRILKKWRKKHPDLVERFQQKISLFTNEPFHPYAIADASEEVLEGKYTRSQLSEMLDKEQLMKVAKELLALTYCQPAKRLPELIEEILVQLPGGEDWINRR